MADNPTNNVALEIAKKLTPKLLALILILTLIALTLVMSFTLYRGGSVSLKDMIFTVPDNQLQLITSLEQDLLECTNKSKSLSQEVNNHKGQPTKEELQQCENENSASISISQLNQILGDTQTADEVVTKIKNLSAKNKEFLKLKQNYFFKLFILERMIPEYGKSISTHYDNDNRRDTYKLLQEILLELGFYNESITGAQASTKEAVIAFQQAYNKKLESDAESGQIMPEAAILQPLGHVGYRTLEAFRSWYRNNAV